MVYIVDLEQATYDINAPLQKMREQDNFCANYQTERKRLRGAGRRTGQGQSEKETEYSYVYPVRLQCCLQTYAESHEIDSRSSSSTMVMCIVVVCFKSSIATDPLNNTWPGLKLLNSCVTKYVLLYYIWHKKCWVISLGLARQWDRDRNWHKNPFEFCIICIITALKAWSI